MAAHSILGQSGSDCFRYLRRRHSTHDRVDHSRRPPPPCPLQKSTGGISCATSTSLPCRPDPRSSSIGRHPRAWSSGRNLGRPTLTNRIGQRTTVTATTITNTTTLTRKRRSSRAP